MKEYPVFLAVVCALLFLGAEAIGAEDSWQEISAGNAPVRAILISPDNNRTIYMGLDNAVLKSIDAGLNWRNSLVLHGQAKGVRALLASINDKNALYAACGSGLFYSNNQGRNWKRVFRGRSAGENSCAALLIMPSCIYLGTESGLFRSLDQGRSWQRAAGKVGKTHVLSITANPAEAGLIYLAALEGVFKSENAGASWEKIFSANNAADEAGEADIEDRDEEDGTVGISDIKSLAAGVGVIYTVTSRGIYKSTDKGLNWEAVRGDGLLDTQIRLLQVSPRGKLYALSRKGVFELRQDRWEELSLRISADEFYCLSIDSLDNVYVGCSKGLFRAKLRHLRGYAGNNPAALYCQGEPDIKEIQKAAVSYAEVDPEKILRWRRQAARKAWLPRVTSGVSRDVGDLWHWETGSTVKLDDDALRKGRDSIGWDVSLTWDLGELLWNSDQTSIDVRSRLMVQLRDDILDEVNRVYFERLRVKMELDDADITDVKKRCEKELRLKELTASLDALTGGYFSQRAG